MHRSVRSIPCECPAQNNHTGLRVQIVLPEWKNSRLGASSTRYTIYTHSVKKKQKTKKQKKNKKTDRVVRYVQRF